MVHWKITDKDKADKLGVGIICARNGASFLKLNLDKVPKGMTADQYYDCIINEGVADCHDVG